MGNPRSRRKEEVFLLAVGGAFVNRPLHEARGDRVLVAELACTLVQREERAMPRIFWSSFGAPPSSRKRTENVWRSACGWTRWCRPARSAIDRSNRRIE